MTSTSWFGVALGCAFLVALAAVATAERFQRDDGSWLIATSGRLTDWQWAAVSLVLVNAAMAFYTVALAAFARVTALGLRLPIWIAAMAAIVGTMVVSFFIVMTMVTLVRPKSRPRLRVHGLWFVCYLAMTIVWASVWGEVKSGGW